MEWISVKDRFPESNGVYLVNIHQENDETGGCGDFVVIAWYQKIPLLSVRDSAGWLLLNEFHDLTDELREDISHWMPFPKPPEFD